MSHHYSENEAAAEERERQADGHLNGQRHGADATVGRAVQTRLLQLTGVVSAHCNTYTLLHTHTHIVYTHTHTHTHTHVVFIHTATHTHHLTHTYRLFTIKHKHIISTYCNTYTVKHTHTSSPHTLQHMHKQPLITLLLIFYFLSYIIPYAFILYAIITRCTS